MNSIFFATLVTKDQFLARTYHASIIQAVDEYRTTT